MEVSESSYVPVADQVGTVWKVVSSGAAAANSYQYDAFGVTRSVSETVSNPFRFAGKPLDADPALYHFIARQYSPLHGRFLGPDAVARHRYPKQCSYAHAGPLAWVDPRGLRCSASGMTVGLGVSITALDASMLPLPSGELPFATLERRARGFIAANYRTHWPGWRFPGLSQARESAGPFALNSATQQAGGIEVWLTLGHWLFFAYAGICEDAEHDCRFKISEVFTWSYPQGLPGDPPPIPPRKKERKGEYGVPGGDVEYAKRRQPLEGFPTFMIFVDAPGHVALNAGGQEYPLHWTLSQQCSIVDASEGDRVVVSMTIELAVDVIPSSPPQIRSVPFG